MINSNSVAASNIHDFNFRSSEDEKKDPAGNESDFKFEGSDEPDSAFESGMESGSGSEGHKEDPFIFIPGSILNFVIHARFCESRICVDNADAAKAVDANSNKIAPVCGTPEKDYFDCVWNSEL